MSLSDRETLELSELCNALIDGHISEPLRARLESWIAESDDARRYYIRAMDLSAGLAHQAGEMQVEAPDGRGGLFRLMHTARWRWLAFAASILLAGAIGIPFWLAHRSASAAPEAVEYVARITGENAVVWIGAATGLKPGAFLRRGQELELTRGFAEVTFDSGAIVLLEGPALLDVNSAWDATLRFGALKANVPAQATGFRISNSAVHIVDVGTEFSMIADGHGTADVMVLKGEVEAMPRGRGDQEALLLHANESRRFALSGISNSKQHDQMLAHFTTPVSLDRFSEPVNYAYWSFDEPQGRVFHPKVFGLPQTGLELTLSSNLSSASESFRGKGVRQQALRFNGKMIANAHFPGLSGGAPRTVAFWVKVPSDAQLSDAYSMVAWRADELGSRPVHIGWNRNPSEGPLGALRTDFSGGHAVGETPLRDGKWHYVTVILMPRDEADSPVQVKQYVDGRLESSTVTPGPKRSIGGNVNSDDDTAFGDLLWLGCRLGSSGPKRERFRGEIDELFIADRGLEPYEIVRLMEGQEFASVSPTNTTQ